MITTGTLAHTSVMLHNYLFFVEGKIKISFLSNLEVYNTATTEVYNTDALAL